MTNSSIVPNLRGSSKIKIDEKTVKTLDCLKCQTKLDVTNVIAGANIECPDCGNITWVPESKPKWWFKLRNFLFAILVSIIVGVLINITTDWFKSNKENSNKLNNENTLQK